MKQKLRFILSLFALLIVGSLQAQDRSVSGVITSAEDGLPVPGVTIIVKGTTNGTTSDIDGKYTIRLPQGTDVLVFSYLGYQTQEVAVGNQSSLNILLQPDDEVLQEVVVVAYGLADKKSFTGSLGEVDADQLAKRPLTNVTNALTGTLSGVVTNSASGQPGSAPDIRIRGVGSINASSSPLYVVDGVPYDQGISNLSADDIESISVLKDASSAALYGARAANGVVMITTKKGKKGSSRLNVKLVQGQTSRAYPEYERVDAFQYYPLMWEAYRNSLAYSGTTPLAQASTRASNEIGTLLGYNPFNVPANQLVSTEGVLNPNARLLYNDFDWIEPITRDGVRKDYNLNYSGSSDNSDYFVSVGYLDEKGYIVNSDFERFTARVNMNTTPLKWLKTGMNMSATYTESNNARTDGSTSFVNPFFFARNMGPIYPVYEHDPATGAFILDNAGNRVYDLGFGPPARPSGASPGRHVVQETLLNKDGFKRTVISGRSYLEADFLKHFTFRANFAADLYSLYDFSFDNKIVGDGAPAGRASRLHSTETTVTLNQLLTYKRNFGDKHSLEVLAGHESYSFVDNGFSGSRQGIIVDGIDELINFTTINSLTSVTSDYAIEGFLSRINYDYAGKYYLSASFRRDGSSRFSKEARWGNFYSIGASWRLDNERFISNLPWINALKLRSSYGQVGNDNLGGFYVSQGLYDLGFNNALEPGFLQATLSNPGLEWETNTSFDVGTDFVLFGSRVSGTFEYFRRESSNLLFDVPLPLSTGVPFASIARNIGTMFNSGLELQLSVDVLKVKDFSWNVNINASTIKNEITKLPPNSENGIITGTKKLLVGRSIYDYWLREYYGVNPANGAPLFRADTYVAASDIIIGSDTLTSNQSRARFHYNGSALPDVYGGITNTFRYKGLSLTVLTTYQIGGLVYDAVYQNLMGGPDYGDAIHVDMLGRWQKEGDVTSIPRLDIQNNPNSGATSDRWLTSATHLNLRQVTLNYDLPSTLLKKAKISNASIYVSGENLQLFSKRVGMDVTQNFTGVTSNGYIPSRILSVGVNVGI